MRVGALVLTTRGYADGFRLHVHAGGCGRAGVIQGQLDNQ